MPLQQYVCALRCGGVMPCSPGDPENGDPENSDPGHLTHDLWTSGTCRENFLLTVLLSVQLSVFEGVMELEEKGHISSLSQQIQCAFEAFLHC